MIINFGRFSFSCCNERRNKNFNGKLWIFFLLEIILSNNTWRHCFELSFWWRILWLGDKIFLLLKCDQIIFMFMDWTREWRFMCHKAHNLNCFMKLVRAESSWRVWKSIHRLWANPKIITQSFLFWDGMTACERNQLVGGVCVAAAVAYAINQEAGDENILWRFSSDQWAHLFGVISTFLRFYRFVVITYICQKIGRSAHEPNSVCQPLLMIIKTYEEMKNKNKLSLIDRILDDVMQNEIFPIERASLPYSKFWSLIERLIALLLILLS